MGIFRRGLDDAAARVLDDHNGHAALLRVTQYQEANRIVEESAIKLQELGVPPDRAGQYFLTGEQRESFRGELASIYDKIDTARYTPGPLDIFKDVDQETSDRRDQLEWWLECDASASWVVWGRTAVPRFRAEFLKAAGPVGAELLEGLPGDHPVEKLFWLHDRHKKALRDELGVTKRSLLHEAETMTRQSEKTVSGPDGHGLM